MSTIFFNKDVAIGIGSSNNDLFGDEDISLVTSVVVSDLKLLKDQWNAYSTII